MSNDRSNAPAERIILTDDLIVEICPRDDDSWLVSFRDGAGRSRSGPPAGTLSIEAISSDHIVRTLKLSAEDADDMLVASGWVEFATHARIVMKTGTGTLRRHHRLFAAQPAVAPSGPLGGALADMGHGASVELLARPEEPWSLVFYDDGVETAAPPAKFITVEVMDSTGRVESFPAVPSGKASTLHADISGIVPARVRLDWAHGDHSHRREFDLLMA